MTINVDQAFRVARDLLDSLGGELNGQEPYVISGIVGHQACWAVHYNTPQGAEGNTFKGLIGNGPILVPVDGSSPFRISSAVPADKQIDEIWDTDQGRERADKRMEIHRMTDEQFDEYDALRRAERAEYPERHVAFQSAYLASRRLLDESSGSDGIAREISGVREIALAWIFDVTQHGGDENAATYRAVALKSGGDPFLTGDDHETIAEKIGRG